MDIKNDNDKPLDDIINNLSENRFFNKRFLEQRKIFLWGPVMDDTAQDVVNRLLYLESVKPNEDISFYINSPGGSVTAGLSIFDAMNMIKSDVATICLGHAASMGAILLSAGTKGKRYIWPSGEVMIHQPSIGGYFQAPASDLEITAKQIQKTKQISAEILAANCGHSVDKILRDFDRDYWMDAKESVDYGIVDQISEKFK